VVGANVTLIVQLVATASELPQVLIWAKSPGFVPVMPMLLMVNKDVPVLLSVTGMAELVVPTAWLPNPMLAGDNATTGARPIPVSGTLCGLPPPLSVTVTLAMRLPAAVGVNVTLIEQ
jgi:hypothetical protein